MFALLSPKLWIALAIAAALAFSHFFIYRAGKAVVQNEYLKAQISADAEARRIERRRQSMVVEAGAAAAKRESALRADAKSARAVASGLRGDLDATERMARESHAAANNAVRTLGELLESCGAAYLGVAEEADRAYSEVKALRDAWPQ